MRTARTHSVDLDHILGVLKSRNQWVAWRREHRNGKVTKVPYNVRSGRRASTTNSASWCSFREAIEAAVVYDGIGFVFAKDDELVGIDLDECMDASGALTPNARRIVQHLDSYTEISPSGQGVHVIVTGRLPSGSSRRRTGGVEMYEEGRYFCMTGRHLAGTPTTVEERTDALAELHRDVFGGPPPSADVDKIVRAIEADGGDRLRRLWRGETSGYASPSEADLALCNLLLPCCDGDAALLDQVFRRGGLMRPKWDENRGRQTYGARTIAKAASKKGRRPAPSTQSELLALPHTDSGNAQRLVLRHGDKLCHVYVSNSWYVWDGKRWREDITGHIVRLAKETFRHLSKVALQKENNEALQRFARSSESRSRLEAAVELARSETAVVITPEQLDAGHWQLNVTNGTIDLRTGALRPHDPADLISKLAPVEYDAEATCPTFDRFLHEITNGRERLGRFIQQLFGMSLTGDISEQILIVFHGAGANGKSTLLDLMLSIMGSYAGVAGPELLVARRWSQHPTEVADLWGKRLVVSIETERGETLRSSFVKSITGDARLKGRFMRQDFFEFDRTFKTILCTNHKPAVPEQTSAIWRRLRLIPFDHIVSEDRQDKRLLVQLQAEAPGVLAWAVRGCLSWSRDGLKTPPEVAEATEGYRSEQDHHERFATECLTLDPSARATSTAISEAYIEWCRESGIEPDPQGFWERLKDWDCERGRTSRERFWRGVEVTDGAPRRSR